MKVTIDSSATEVLTDDVNTAERKVSSLCTLHKLKGSSFAKVTGRDGAIMIATSYGTLVADKDLLVETRQYGNPKGHQPGRNATGHYLPPHH